MSRASGCILGIDLGVNSLGAALIDPRKQCLLWTGVRIFTPAFEGDYASGNEESRARRRRLMRQQRRQTDRRRRRMINVFHLLQQFGLLPDGAREAVLPALDATLIARYPETEVLPYLLRARALDHSLEPHELGRALYHLAQRRGFCGRVAREAGEKEGGKLKKDIEGLWAEIHASGSRTLGEHLSTLDPHSTRIRTHRTHRRMYKEEFSAIWAAQQPHHPDILSDDLKQALHHALFHQRPLKPADHLIGDCELERGQKRAPMWALEAQDYRVLTAINNLRLVEKGGTVRPLNDRERNMLIDESRKNSKLKFTQVRKLLGLAPNSRFSVEEGGEENLPGNVTSARMFDVLGNDWLEMPPERQRDLVADLGDTKTDEDLLRCLQEKWSFTPELADKLCAVPLPDKYASLSLKAIEKVTPLLEQGKTFAEAKRLLWPEHFVEKEPLDFLPPVNETDLKNELRNPAVLRALGELRKVVNGVVRQFGKPASIHIELARDMKRTRQERQRESKRNREREKLRDEARRELKQYLGENIARRDIEKYLLWKECKMTCPYSGESIISLSALFGEHPRFDVEHIIPFDRSLDDSFQNKTLCEAGANSLKRKRTPWEAFGHAEEWPQMVERVREFGNTPKLRRFTMKETETAELLENFTTRQLNDTKYASRLAARYLGLLYGIDHADNSRIITCAGRVTAFLRQKWDLNRILNEKPEKSREDYRHHTVDAIAVALATPAQVKALADAASRAQREGHRRFGSLADPWPGFRDQAREMVLDTLVSHRPKRRLKAALHDETHYSPPAVRNGKKVVGFRKPVEALTAGDIENIADEKTKGIVRAAWEAAGRDAKKLLNNWPVMETKRRRLPVKRVRCLKVQEVCKIAKDDPARTRYVIPGGNHHMEIWAELDPKTNQPKKYAYDTVSLLEANERYSRGERIVQRDHGPNCTFCFSLSEGDLVKARRPSDEQERIWYVRSVRSRGSLVLSPATDARKKELIKDQGSLWDATLNTLMRLGAAKVVVTPLGEVVKAHD
jgi:CRISPR-associated endonuclease Csn1